MDIQERFDRLDAMIAEGRLLRNGWTSVGEDGKESACILAAISPETAETKNPGDCPISVMPAWFAYIVLWMSDNGSIEEWHQMVRRFASILRRTTVLSIWDLELFEYNVRAICIRDAMSNTKDEKVLSVCQRVIDLCESTAMGNMHSKEQWEETRGTTMLWRATAVIRSAEASNTMTTAFEAQYAVVDATEVMNSVKARAAMRKAVDRMTSKILDALEIMCEKAENQFAEDVKKYLILA